MSENWIAVFETKGGEVAGRRVTFDAEDWTFQAAQTAAQEMADAENHPDEYTWLDEKNPDFMMVKLYTAAQLEALDKPEPQLEDQDWATPVLKALQSVQQAARHGRTNKRAVKTLSELVPQFLDEYAELTRLTKVMMQAWEDLNKSQQQEMGQAKTSSGLVLASTADVAAVRQRKGL